ncbi:MAG TPA: 23S rRNA (uracil(1939)-C(5))-methyltransferase RlmD [Flavobacteriaceae bacterium]|nr:23S rRNA (uracil(1939)-C(5))-methyltransferase RlmD [Flavobacteriaceae bacterium]
MGKRSNRKIFTEVRVQDAGAKGKAVAKAPDGRVLFINNAIPGDVVTVQTTKQRKAYFEATAIEFHEYSKDRVPAICPHFGVCGGCKWQHMDYQKQLFYKNKEVQDHLKRIGGITPEEVLPILGAPDQFYYRNKMEYSFSSQKWLTRAQIESDQVIDNRNALGFHIPGFWDKILDLKECHLQDAKGNEIRDFIKHKAQELDLIFFDPRAQTGHLRTLMLRNTTLGQWMVLIQFYENPGPLRDLLLKSVAEAFPEVNSLLYVINQKANDTLYDQDIEVYQGKDYIEEAMGNLRFRINAKSFYQTNSKQAIGLYNIVKEFAGLTGGQGVYDLYTGTGTIAQYLAAEAKWVVGIESVSDAIQAAKENAQRNHIENAQFFVGDMKELFDKNFIAKHGKADVVITDPPRDGMHKSVVDQLIALGAPRIVYVSCNSATQARDLALMKEHYKVVKSRAVDMFPQTHHVENVVLLEKIQ